MTSGMTGGSIGKWEPSDIKKPHINPWNEPPKNQQIPKSLPPVSAPSLASLFNSQFFLGFNDQVARWESLNNLSKKTAFPPYNLIKEDDENQRIEIAVAGYSKEDIDISVKVDLLTIKGYKKDEDSDAEFIHQGIAGREWKQEFVLGEWITVKEASLKDGLLTIRLVREVPEEMKPKVIKIK